MRMSGGERSESSAARRRQAAASHDNVAAQQAHRHGSNGALTSVTVDNSSFGIAATGNGLFRVPVSGADQLQYASTAGNEAHLRQHAEHNNAEALGSSGGALAAQSTPLETSASPGAKCMGAGAPPNKSRPLHSATVAPAAARNRLYANTSRDLQPLLSASGALRTIYLPTAKSQSNSTVTTGGNNQHDYEPASGGGGGGQRHGDKAALMRVRPVCYAANSRATLRSNPPLLANGAASQHSLEERRQHGQQQQTASADEHRRYQQQHGVFDFEPFAARFACSPTPDRATAACGTMASLASVAAAAGRRSASVPMALTHTQHRGAVWPVGREHVAAAMLSLALVVLSAMGMAAMALAVLLALQYYASQLAQLTSGNADAAAMTMNSVSTVVGSLHDIASVTAGLALTCSICAWCTGTVQLFMCLKTIKLAPERAYGRVLQYLRQAAYLRFVAVFAFFASFPLMIVSLLCVVHLFGGMFGSLVAAAVFSVVAGAGVLLTGAVLGHAAYAWLCGALAPLDALRTAAQHAIDQQSRVDTLSKKNLEETKYSMSSGKNLSTLV